MYKNLFIMCLICINLNLNTRPKAYQMRNLKAFKYSMCMCMYCIFTVFFKSATGKSGQWSCLEALQTIESLMTYGKKKILGPFGLWRPLMPLFKAFRLLRLWRHLRCLRLLKLLMPYYQVFEAFWGHEDHWGHEDSWGCEDPKDHEDSWGNEDH